MLLRFKKGEITTEQFKGLAKAATHALYKSEVALGGLSWEEQAGIAVRHAMKRMRIGKYA